MKKLLLILLLLAVVVSCNPKVDPVEAANVPTMVEVRLLWTSYCSYCVKQMLVMQEIQEWIVVSDLEGSVVITTQNPFDTPTEIVGFLREHDLTLTVSTKPSFMPTSGVPVTSIHIRGEDKPTFIQVGFVEKDVLLGALQDAVDKLIWRGRVPPQRV